MWFNPDVYDDFICITSYRFSQTFVVREFTVYYCFFQNFRFRSHCWHLNVKWHKKLDNGQNTHFKKRGATYFIHHLPISKYYDWVFKILHNLFCFRVLCFAVLLKFTPTWNVLLMIKLGTTDTELYTYHLYDCVIISCNLLNCIYMGVYSLVYCEM